MKLIAPLFVITGSGVAHSLCALELANVHTDLIPCGPLIVGSVSVFPSLINWCREKQSSWLMGRRAGREAGAARHAAGSVLLS